ncbi:AHH domain-containing protein [Cellvibrio sp. PSBB023]|uniref:AHH domain-containing protein n=1 Tax=Cellvibrio sp. PSBB023 TaxID=1945512 RepID=UPI00098F37BA|nr:AHH domain-containing protein [Cellvibrio sp. PSBB023]AQT60627.1 hypothetical protein B0D95_11485 [Cellvibrio sp. PSBB023]
MEYQNGRRTLYRYDEMTLLDRAIEALTRKAEKYFDDLNIAERSPPDVREKRKMELEKAKRHLDHERRLAEVIVDVQVDLQMYRAKGRLATQGTNLEIAKKQKQLLEETHHPTEILEKYMRAVPIPKPSKNHSAHHITPGIGKTKDAYRARLRIHRFGIRINDPDNGVWLPRATKHTPHWSMPEAKGHNRYHTHGYESWLFRRLQTKSSEEFIRQELRLIGQALQENNIPPEARKK